MLIGGDGISNVITLGTCFSMFVYIRTCFRITLIGGNVTAQSTESQGNWRWNSNSRGVVASSPSFSCLRESLLAGYPARDRSCGRLFSKRNHCELIPTTVLIFVNPLIPRVTNINFLLTISTHFQRKRFREFIMVIELSGVQFGLKSYAWFQTRVRFEITSMISVDQNCTTRSSITSLLHPFWNRTI